MIECSCPALRPASSSFDTCRSARPRCGHPAVAGASFIGRVAATRAQWPDWLDGTGWRWSVSGGEVRRDRGTTAVGAGYPPRFGLRSSARIVALFTVGFLLVGRV